MKIISISTIANLVLAAATLLPVNDGNVFAIADHYMKAHPIKGEDLKCVSYSKDRESTATVFYITVHEYHGDGCPGDPQTGPRVLTLRIVKKTGSITNDYMKPGEFHRGIH